MTGSELPKDTLTRCLRPEQQAQESLLIRRLMSSAGVAYDPIPHDPSQNGSGAEIAQLDSLLNSQSVLPDEYDIVTVGDAGYVVNFMEPEVRPDSAWLLTDYDDLLIATTEAKARHSEAYAEYIKGIGVAMDATTQERLVRAANQFARWNENGQEIYHIDANIVALGWATKMLCKLGRSNPLGMVKICEARLADIATGLTEDRAPRSTDPFHFSRGQLVVKNHNVVSDRFIEVFKPLVRPDVFPDSFEAVRQASAAVDGYGEQSPNLAVFTYGKPDWQLMKLILTMKEQASISEPLPLSQLWLTRVYKGKFVEQLASLAVQPSPNSVMATEVIQSPGLVLTDDDPNHLNSFMSASVPTVLGAVRSARQGTKTAGKPWIGQPRELTTSFDPSAAIGPLNDFEAQLRLMLQTVAAESRS
ncbi:MAG: hypothetical protein AAB971_03075 [Patescibacteria group bacterium]